MPLLLSLVYLHQGALDEIPPVGHMTIFDKIMVINFALFINAILSLAIQMKFHTENKEYLVTKVNEYDDIHSNNHSSRHSLHSRNIA